jgi:signal transduction histidine kinase
MLHLFTRPSDGEQQRLPAALRRLLRLLRPIHVRLSLVCVLFLLLVVGVGWFGINQLSSFHAVSAQISGRWLQSNRILGDLNNYISDFRANEADLLITGSSEDLNVAEQRFASLDEAIARGQRRYGRIDHDDDDAALYRRFAMQWAAYRQFADRVRSFAHGGQMQEAISLYHGESRQAFDAANGTLGELTEHNVRGAKKATQLEATAYDTARRLIAGAIVIAAALVIAAVLYIVQAVSNPIAVLVERMHRIADNDPYVDVPGTGRGDEIGDIAHAVVRFRDNTIELGRSKAVLAEQAARLQDTLENERRMAQMQQNFVSMASHEFRTPLNVIDGHAQRLVRMKETPTSELIVERCGRIRAAVRRMTGVIDHLLDSSQLLDGAIAGERLGMDFSLILLLHEVCEMHRESSPTAVVEEFVEAGTPEIFHGDAKLLFQAFSNLVANAIKYSPEGAAVRVQLSGDDTAVRIAITDHGIGIPEKDLGHMFDRFVRGANVAGTAGAGVGLYLSKLAIELHRGTVTVESTEGQGSRFEVWLPQHSPAERSAAS